ncbi:MAG UNVERIFIED_CONTAM: glycogen/starch synthase [Microcystis novacekii LVE1205-3]
MDKNGRYEIYHHDLDSEPCQTDASRYALFCIAVAQGIEQGIFGHLDCIHLNYWHSAVRSSHPPCLSPKLPNSPENPNGIHYQ